MHVYILANHHMQYIFSYRCIYYVWSELQLFRKCGSHKHRFTYDSLVLTRVRCPHDCYMMAGMSVHTHYMCMSGLLG